MYAQVEKPKENKSRAVASSVAQKKSDGKQGVGFVDNRSESLTQRKIQSLTTDSISQPIQKKENNTGLPDDLKSGMENLSGVSLDDVKVHRNSSKPAQLQAHAYAQGTDIHLGIGQEKYLPHETWHTVQQKQGRVKPTLQMQGNIQINEDAGLEKEADTMGVKALQMKPVSQPASLLKTQVSCSAVTQGYFMNGMVKGKPDEMEQQFSKMQKLNYWTRIQPLFNDYNKDDKDRGQLYNWLINTARSDSQKRAVQTIAIGAGIKPSKFSEALGAVGAEEKKPATKPNLTIDVEAIKTAELANEKQGGEPVSPRHRSRIIQIPNLIAMMNTQFATNPLLKNFDFILAGGSALTIKLGGQGRLGRPSTNMRDIDMDFQLRNGITSSTEYVTLERKGEDKLVEGVRGELRAEIKKLTGSIPEALDTGDGKVTYGNTIMFESGDLEYSFHYVPRNTTEPNLNFDKVYAPSGEKLAVIRDDSHWAMTKSALEKRLARPDKIHKTLIDAMVLAGTDAKRVQEISTIIVNKGRNISEIKRALYGLYHNRNRHNPGTGTIAGLDSTTATGISTDLGKINKSSIKTHMNNDEIKAARLAYFDTVKTILKDVGSKASTQTRHQVLKNVETVIMNIDTFLTKIKSKEYYVNIKF